MKTSKGLVAIGVVNLFFNVSAQDAPPLSVMEVIPTVGALGVGWSREIGLLFDPASSPPEIVATSAPRPEARTQADREAVRNPANPISGWAHAHFDFRTTNQSLRYEVQIERYRNKPGVVAAFDQLLASDAEGYQKVPVREVGDDAVLFRNASGVTLWFRRGTFRVWITPLGLPSSWENDSAFQHLAKTFAGRMGEGKRTRKEKSPDSAVIPPFVAEARLLTRGFRADTKTLNYDTDSAVVFLYSNGWWEVEARYPATSTRTNVENCMRIPDGTRSYTLFEHGTNSGLTATASACPNLFPPPGRPELLIPWLSLCPRPDLPLIDGRRMRRFINLPICRPDIFNAPQNEGFYVLKHMAPEKTFVSELMVTNNGFSIELTVTQNGPEGEIHRYAAPLDNGFLDFHYQVIETTNFNGTTFPLRTTCALSSSDWSTKDPSDLRVHLVSELTVTRISFPEKDLASHIVTPGELLVSDARPPNLPENRTLGYLVVGDQWKPVSDPEIERRAHNARKLRQTDN